LKIKIENSLRELYRKYYQATKELMADKAITRTIYRGNGLMPVIGEEEWDQVGLYEYPSIDAFIEMNRDKRYQDVVPLRTNALIDSRLYCTIPEIKDQ
jgi:uncharacterized protein (DUF1330 family)